MVASVPVLKAESGRLPEAYRNFNQFLAQPHGDTQSVMEALLALMSGIEVPPNVKPHHEIQDVAEMVVASAVASTPGFEAPNHDLGWLWSRDPYATARRADDAAKNSGDFRQQRVSNRQRTLSMLVTVAAIAREVEISQMGSDVWGNDTVKELGDPDIALPEEYLLANIAPESEPSPAREFAMAASA